MIMVQARKGFQLEWNSKGEGRAQIKLLKDTAENPRQTTGNRGTMGQQLSTGSWQMENRQSLHNGTQTYES